MKKIGGLIVSILLVGLMVPAPSNAQQPQATEEQIDRFLQALDDARARLQLTDAQSAEMEPILIEQLQAQAEILKDYGFSRESRPRLSFRQRIELGRTLKRTREPFTARVQEVLDEDQFEEYLKMQDETRKRLRQRVQSNP